MTGSHKVFVDTAPFIYLIEDHPVFAKPLTTYFADQLSLFESQFFSSSITIAELFVKPKQQDKLELIDQFMSKLREYDVLVADITFAIADYSADLRKKYAGLKALDALQLATAIRFGCTQFLTNDHRLKSLKEIDVITLNDLID